MEIIEILRSRFVKSGLNIDFAEFENRLLKAKKKLLAISQMEETSGEPELIYYDEFNDKYIVIDATTESPKERRSLCYDDDALFKRVKFTPKGSALGLASSIGANIINEEDYRMLQKYKKVDLKTSSWIDTPTSIRNLGGALFCDRRYDNVFLYHNGADSYYESRGVRFKIEL